MSLRGLSGLPVVVAACGALWVLALGPSRWPAPPKVRIAKKLGELPRSTEEAVELLGL